MSGDDAGARSDQYQIRIRGIKKAFAEHQVLKGVDLDVERGKINTIIGGSGQGKSVLLKHIIGLLRPTSGTIVIAGHDIARQRVAQLARQAGLVFQEPDEQLFRSSVRAEVDFGASSPAAVREALAATGLAGREADHPYDLGYSRRKLLTIAAVLAMETPIVLLDEPTLGQDAAGRALIIGILRRLQATGRTGIVAGHDRALMAATLDRTVTLAAGRLI